MANLGDENKNGSGKPKIKRLGIRPMKWGDLNQVMEIETLSFMRPWNINGFIMEIVFNSLSCYLVALDKTEKEKVVGYGGIWFMSQRAHITTLAVHPRYHNCGVGSKLVNSLKQRARYRGCTRMTLEVRVSNEAARHLYQKHGFTVSSVSPDYYYDEDALVMEINLLKERSEQV